MTARELQRLSHQELELELQYTFDQIKRLYNQINQGDTGATVKALMVKELFGYKQDFIAITHEFERRYIP